MLIEFPLSYRVYCKPFRQRHRGSVGLLDFVSIDVREIDEADAPVGVRASMGGQSEVLRWFDGKYWIEDFCAPEAAKIRASLSSRADPETFGSNSFFLATNYPATIEVFKARERKTVESERCREVTGSSREASLEYLEKAVAERVAIIGGKAYCTVEEPVMALSIYDGGFAVAQPQFGLPYIGNRNRTLTFTLDRLADFDDLVVSLGRDGIEVRRDGELAHFFGGVTPVRREREDLLQCVEEAILEDSYRMKEWTKNRAMAWFDLRDVHAAASEAGRLSDDATLDRLSECLAEYGRHTEISHFARVAVERWQFRQIDFDVHHDAPTPAMR